MNRSRTGTAGQLTLCFLSLSVATHSFAQQDPLNFLADLSLEELANLEITSVSRRPESLSDAVAAIFVITGDALRRAGATSLTEALRLAPNLHVAQRGSQNWAISARGFNTELANKLLVMIDGRSIYTPLYSGVNWNRQDYLLDDIDRIEVISGPGGTLWGANAVNGIINIITKSSADSQGNLVEAGTGSELSTYGAIRHGGITSADTSYRVYAKYFDRDGQVFRDGTDAPDAWDMIQTGFRVDSTPSQNDSYTFSGDYYNSDSTAVTGKDGDVSGYNLLGRWQHSLAGGSSTNLMVYYDYTFSRFPVEARLIDGNVVAPAGYFEDRLDTFNMDFQHDLELAGSHHVVWGISYRFTRNDITNAPGLAFDPEDLDRNLYSVFLQDEIAINDDLALIGGVKFEHNDYTGLEIQPSIRLRYHPTDNQTLWAAVSRAVRTPSRVDRDVLYPTPALSPVLDNLLVGGKDFDSEQVVAYEAGYRIQANANVSLSLSVFYNDYDKIRSAGLTPVTVFPVVFRNDLEGETHGLELSADFQLSDWWRLGTGASLLEEDIRVASDGFDLNNALNETADPEHQLALRSIMNLSPSMELYAGLRRVGGFSVNNEGSPLEVPAYTELDMRLGWTVTDNFEVSIIGQNLLDDQHLEYLTPGADGAPLEIQRAVFVRGSYRF